MTALRTDPGSLASDSGSQGYFKESRQPIYSAWLVLPFLLVYEAGLLVMRSDVINGGDAIVMTLGAPLLKRMGVEGGLISVLILAAAFIFWQIRRKGKWRIHPPVLTAMFFESLFFAVVLFLMLGFFVHHLNDIAPRQGRPGRHASLEQTAPQNKIAGLAPCAVQESASSPALRDFVLYCGAGVFEELVFRVMLLGILLLVLTRLLHMEHAYAAAWSVFLGAAIFSAFHHIGGERFELNVFIQRLFAGLYFSALYYNRCFGVAAASHALYDILVGLNQFK